MGRNACGKKCLHGRNACDKVLDSRRNMRIQEMRSGFSHLKKKMESERPNNVFELHSLLDPELLDEPAEVDKVVEPSELSEPRWSVVSFERTEISGQTYAQAVETMSDLESRGANGLCIVTDEAAARVKQS